MGYGIWDMGYGIWDMGYMTYDMDMGLGMVDRLYVIYIRDI